MSSYIYRIILVMPCPFLYKKIYAMMNMDYMGQAENPNSKANYFCILSKDQTVWQMKKRFWYCRLIYALQFTLQICLCCNNVGYFRRRTKIPFI